MDVLGEWIKVTRPVLTLVASVIVIASFVSAKRAWLAKVRGVHRLPCVRATIRTVWKGGLCAVATLFVQAAVQYFQVAANVEQGADRIDDKHDEGGDGQGAQALADEAEKPMVIRGQDVPVGVSHVLVSHSDLPLKEFDWIVNNIYRCRTCARYFKFVDAGDSVQAVALRAEEIPHPAPRGIYMNR